MVQLGIRQAARVVRSGESEEGGLATRELVQGRTHDARQDTFTTENTLRAAVPNGM